VREAPNPFYRHKRGEASLEHYGGEKEIHSWGSKEHQKKTRTPTSKIDVVKKGTHLFGRTWSTLKRVKENLRRENAREEKKITLIEEVI